MTNGTDGYGDTPTDLPVPTLPEHRPYVLLLVDVVGSLHEIANRLGEFVHEIRIARDPIGISGREMLAETGAIIEQIGAKVKVGFGG